MPQTQLTAFPFASLPRSGPPPEFAAARRDEPVLRVLFPTGDVAWLVTRYSDVRQVLNDSRFSRAAAEAPGAPRMGNTSPGPQTILGMDPPEHTRLRKLVAKAFTARRIAGLRPRTEELAAGLIDRLIEAGPPADLMSGFALALPIRVIFEMLGVPHSDSDHVHALTDVIFSLSAHSREEVMAARTGLLEFLAQMIASRRRAPTDDLIGFLVTARDENDSLTETELLNFTLILLTVGHHSTANGIASAAFTLLSHPGQLRQLRDDPSLIPAAVEELLRFNPLVLTGAQLRVATEQVDLGGVTIEPGDAVLPAIASANRDEHVFAGAGQLDLTRPDNPHLAFGYGTHHCLGAQLARLELQIAIAMLVSRLPDMRLAIPSAELTWKTGLASHSLASLPVTW